MKKKIVSVALSLAAGVFSIVLPMLLLTKAAYAHSLSLPHVHVESAALFLVAIAAVSCTVLAVKIRLVGAVVENRKH